jgi:(2R)-ethylmalonyl-CoA mutase
MIAVAARQAGFDVIYQGIRLTVNEIIQTAAEEHVDVIGISILSGSHMDFAKSIHKKMLEENMSIPVIFGGIIPINDFEELKTYGVVRIFTPSDFHLVKIMEEILNIIESYESNK